MSIVSLVEKLPMILLHCIMYYNRKALTVKQSTVFFIKKLPLSFTLISYKLFHFNK